MYTLSWHQQGNKANQDHNIRQAKSISKNKTSFIDLDKTKKNITIVHEPVREAYERLFSEAVEEFNNRQKNHDRIIKDYYSRIQQDTKKHTAYEIIVQVGSVSEGTPFGMEQAVLAEYAQTFQKRNPNLQVIGAYVHNDEATPHLHLDYIPVAECKRGMKIQNSLSEALKAQGFITQCKSQTAQIQWEQSEREAMREICRNWGVELKKQGKGRKHLELTEYKQAQNQIADLQLKIKDKQDTIDMFEKSISAKFEQCKKLNDRIDNLAEIYEDNYQEIDEALQIVAMLQEQYPDYYTELQQQLDIPNLDIYYDDEEMEL